MRTELLRLFFLVAASAALLVACGSDRRGNQPSTTRDAATGDADWKCEVGSYYECEGAGACRGAAQCLSGGTSLGSCRCIAVADAGASSDATIGSVCTPGEVSPCNGSGGCQGMAQCQDDGRALGVCSCPDAGAMPDASLGNGRCSNTNDSEGLGLTYAFGTVPEILTLCELTCSIESNPSPTCLSDCIFDLVAGSVSRQCLTCYDTDATCNAESGCDLLCTGLTDDICTSCLCGELGGRACTKEFDSCTGIASGTCS